MSNDQKIEVRSEK